MRNKFRLEILMITIAIMLMSFIAYDSKAYNPNYAPNMDDNGFCRGSGCLQFYNPYPGLAAAGMPIQEMPLTNPYIKKCIDLMNNDNTPKLDEKGNRMQSCVWERQFPNAMTDAQRKEAEAYKNAHPGE